MVKVSAPKGGDIYGGGDFLKAPGTYHFLIQQINAGVGPKGTPINGFTAEVIVLGGVADDGSNQEKKNAKFTFFEPDLTKDHKLQLMNERQNTAFLIATNVLRPEHLGVDDLELDENQANGHQFIAKIASGQKKDEKSGKYVDDPNASVQIHFSDIFHVDDPVVAKLPKNSAMLNVIDKAFRHDAKWFAWKEPKGGNGNSSKNDVDDALDGIA